MGQGFSKYACTKCQSEWDSDCNGVLNAVKERCFFCSTETTPYAYGEEPDEPPSEGTAREYEYYLMRLTKVVDAYKRDDLNIKTAFTLPKDVDIITTKDGTPLLTLQDCIDARESYKLAFPCYFDADGNCTYKD